MRAFIAIVGLLALCANAGATTIVAIWTPSRIVIAGDSLLNNYWTRNGVRQHGTSEGCKIRKFGVNYISAAGNYHIQKAGFDLWDTAARACTTSGNVELCAARLKADLAGVLSRAVSVHEVNVTVLVAGRQNGVPAMEHITFIGQPDGKLNVRTESFRRGRQQWGRVILGDRDAIDRYEHGAASTMSENLEQQAVSLVKIEARAVPQEVGAPFSTLSIEAKSERWINPGCCQSSCSK